MASLRRVVIVVDAPRILAQVEALSESATAVLAAKNAAREAALGPCREAIRNSANAIRAVHRGDFATAEQLSDKAGLLCSR